MNSPIGEIIDVIGKIRAYRDMRPSDAFNELAREMAEVAERQEKGALPEGTKGPNFFNFMLYVTEWWLIHGQWPHGLYILVIYGPKEECDSRAVFLWVDDARWHRLWGSISQFVGDNFPQHSGMKLVKADPEELREIIVDAVDWEEFPRVPADVAIRLAATTLTDFLETLEQTTYGGLPPAFQDLKNRAGQILSS